MPDGWAPMAEEYELTDADRESGLAEALYNGQDLAVKALKGFVNEIGGDTEKLKFLDTISVGIEDESDVPGWYEPGKYGIVMGRESDDIDEFYDEDTGRSTRRFARTIAHEMVHAVQTVAPEDPKGRYRTAGDAIMGWSGLEEGMAEAIGSVAMAMETKQIGMDEAAKNLEKLAKERDAYATQMGAKLIQKLSPETMNWYITSDKHEVKPGNDELEKIFGDDYLPFLRNMKILLDREEDKTTLSEETILKYAEETEAMINRISQ